MVKNRPEQFRRGLEIELEHGAVDLETNVTGDNPPLAGKIAWAHLKEIKDYYTRLDQLEAVAEGKVCFKTSYNKESKSLELKFQQKFKSVF